MHLRWWRGIWFHLVEQIFVHGGERFFLPLEFSIVVSAFVADIIAFVNTFHCFLDGDGFVGIAIAQREEDGDVEFEGQWLAAGRSGVVARQVVGIVC